jgi:hypothetical protein
LYVLPDITSCMFHIAQVMLSHMYSYDMLWSM